MRIFILTTLVLFSSIQLNAQKLDRSKPPKAAPARAAQFGNATEYALDNGLKVIIVENHKLPRVSVQLSIDRKPVIEGDKIGLLDMIGSVLMAGTESKSKAEIDESIDFIGASLSFSSTGMYASSLNKHTEKLMDIAQDILYNPSFPEEELDKLKTQAISGIQTQKNDPDAISSNVSAVLNYGSNHPYGEVGTEKEIEAITINDIKNYYNNFFKPNASYLIIVGDISVEKAKALVNNYFSKWQKGQIIEAELPNVNEVGSNKVIFVDRPGAVQSAIRITYPVDLKQNSSEVFPAMIMNEILGGGSFSARLLTNLREDKAYTYGAYSRLKRDRYIGEFSATANVRNEVTDSAIVQFMYEMNRIRTEKVEEEVLQLVKNRLAGSYARSLERPQTLARFALNTALYNLPKDYYKNYLKMLDNVTADQVLAAAKKFIRPNKANILVVGNQSEVAKKLAPFSAQNEVLYYDAYGKPIVNLEPIDLSVDDLLENSLLALSSQKKLKKAKKSLLKVKTLKQHMTMEITGLPMGMVVEVVKVNGQKMFREIKAGGQTFQKTTFNGSVGKESGLTSNKTFTPEENEDIRRESLIFAELTYNKVDNKLEILGIDKGLIKVKRTYTYSDKETFYYYDPETWLIKRIVSMENSPEGAVVVTTEVESYKAFDGYLFPEKMKQSIGSQSFNMTTTKIEINPKFDDSIFE